MKNVHEDSNVALRVIVEVTAFPTHFQSAINVEKEIIGRTKSAVSEKSAVSSSEIEDISEGQSRDSSKASSKSEKHEVLRSVNDRIST